jgi:hypothetical protein
MAVVAMRKPKVTVGSVIDLMSSVRTERRQLAAQDKILSENYNELEAQLIDMLDNEDTSKATGRKATASIQTVDNFNIEDWDVFWAACVKNKWSHLIQRRVSAPAAREIAAAKGNPPPGLKAFVKRSIHLTDI